MLGTTVTLWCIARAALCSILFESDVTSYNRWHEVAAATNLLTLDEAVLSTVIYKLAYSY